MASVFSSYSHKDEALRDELEKHLALLKRQGLIEAWHDRRILAGDEVDDAISGSLEAADIVLLLVSSDFISSNYCYSREMTRALERHDAEEARVIPVLLRHCDWHSAPFGKLLAVPSDGKPIASWPDRDEAFTDVAKQVRKAVESLGARYAADPGAQRVRPFPVPPPSLGSRTEQRPRTSNLRLKKEFTEHEHDDFLRSTFEFVCKFFDGSLDEISLRNPGVTGKFERIDSRRMAAVLYRDGKKIAECSVRLGGLAGWSNGLAFSDSASADQNSLNHMLNVETNDQALYLKNGMGWGGGERDKQLSQEGAAEFFWDMFIKNAQ